MKNLRSLFIACFIPACFSACGDSDDGIEPGRWPKMKNAMKQIEDRLFTHRDESPKENE